MLKFAELSRSLSIGDLGRSGQMVKEVSLAKGKCNIFL
jgi:hypothetical protein